MLQFQPKRYTTQEALLISRAISKQLQTDPFAFQTQGVFRVSGDHQHMMQIIDDILGHRKFMNPQYSIHDYISALKHVLMNADLLAKQDPSIHKLKAKLTTEDVTEGLAQGLEGVIEFIQVMAESDDRYKFMVAEVVYDYLHLLSNALTFQVKNKMNAQNLGIIAGPFLAGVVEEDASEGLNLTLKFNQIFAVMIERGCFQECFEEVYKPRVDRWREKDLAELEEEKTVLERVRERYAQRVASFREDIAADKEKLKAQKKRPFQVSPETMVLEYTVSQKQMGIQILKNDDKTSTLHKLKVVEEEIRSIKEAQLSSKPSKKLLFSRSKVNSETSMEVDSPVPETLTELALRKNKHK